ncbi:MAG: shikimate kinase [Acidimicrobiia bacterium]|nr:shikimate kinase [Acidimicrobiia bacterium]MDH5289371.1 shikimate kinase [Acidimicrobiia bacterium]
MNGPSVVLTGFMATGKTTVGRALADLLGYRFVDTDAVITERHGPIPAIFAQQGEDAFRRIEREVAAELAGHPDLVVATGGRLMLDPANVATLGAPPAVVVCLQASAEAIVARLRADATGVEDRPLLAGDDPERRVRDLLTERAAGYGRFPPVPTEGRTPGEIAEEIAALVIVDASPAPAPARAAD